jgi:hypothetical protein
VSTSNRALLVLEQEKHSPTKHVPGTTFNKYVCHHLRHYTAATQPELPTSHLPNSTACLPQLQLPVSSLQLQQHLLLAASTETVKPCLLPALPLLPLLLHKHAHLLPAAVSSSPAS